MILNVVVGVVVGSGHDGGSGCDGGGICVCLDGGGCDGGNDDVVIEATVTVVMAMVRMVGVMVMGLVGDNGGGCDGGGGDGYDDVSVGTSSVSTVDAAF